MAQQAVETLVRRLAGDISGEPLRQLLDFQLVVRRSTGGPGQPGRPVGGECHLVSA
jgi:DNA-binding LacI/PurR family transcriptional regulator